MENKKKVYFVIAPENIPQDKNVFPFNLFVYNPVNSEHSSFLFANSPLDENKSKLLKVILEKGGKLSIDLEQKRLFLSFCNLKEENVASLREKEKHELVKLREERIKKRLAEIEEGGVDFLIKKEIKIAINEDNFSNLMAKLRDDVLLFSVTASPTISTAIDLTEKLLQEDNSTNRIVTLSYFFALMCEYHSEGQLADLIVASYFHHIGLTQIDSVITQKPRIEMKEMELEQFKNHPLLTLHLMHKSHALFSDRVLQIVLEHHEREDGSGWPQAKTEPHIEPLALVLALASYLVEFSDGTITGTKTNMLNVIRLIRSRSMLPGLEFKFGDTIYKNVVEAL